MTKYHSTDNEIIKQTKNLKGNTFHVIPYTHSSLTGLFTCILLATMTMLFPGTSLGIKKINLTE